MTKSSFLPAAALSLAATLSSTAQQPPVPSGPQTDGDFRKVILDADQMVNGEYQDTLADPMELTVAKDGRVFYAERAGVVKMWSPQTKQTTVIGKIEVFTGLEDGLLGITLDPNFLKNGWIYLNHSIPETGVDSNGQKTGANRISRFTFKDGQIDMGSGKDLFDIRTQRQECCHAGGSMTFDAYGNLYVSAGDNTNPFASDGYAPIDQRPGRSPWDAEKSAANSNDLRGKILRVHPEADGTYTIPAGNLFKPGTAKTRPEIYVMGCRNPFRISVDRKTDYLYWGEVGPDAGGFNENRGPTGHDEINQARAAGNFGWPFFVGDNKAYNQYDFAASKSGPKFDALRPVNTSPNNTGLEVLPPAQPAFIWYPPGFSTKFPALNLRPGGRTAMAGPVYYYDAKLKSEHKLPKEYNHTLFIYEWSRNWIMAVHLDAQDHIAKKADNSLWMDIFCPQMSFKRPMDIELGPDGCLYVIEWGTAWGNNKDTQIVRLEYTGPQS
jgi:cytochrome c